MWWLWPCWRCQGYLYAHAETGANLSLTNLNPSNNTSTATTTINPADTTAPTTAISISGTSGLNGWYVSPVTMTLNATDNPAGSGVSTTQYSVNDGSWATYTGPFTISEEGITKVHFRSVDVSGNIEETQNQEIKIDKTAPTMSISGPAIVLQGTSASATVVASDSLSGLDVNPSGNLALDTGATGVHTVTVTAEDKAGNPTSATLTYTVWGIDGPFSPFTKVSQFKAGALVPVKLQITDGTNLISTASGTVSIGSASDVFQWDVAKQQYVANVRTTNAEGTFDVIANINGVGSVAIAQVQLR